MRLACLLGALFLTIALSDCASASLAHELPPVTVRPLSAFSAEVEVGAQSHLAASDESGSLSFGPHSAASLDLRTLSAAAMTLHLGEVDVGQQHGELAVLWSEEGHFPRLYLNSTSLSFLQILVGESHDSLVVHHMPAAFKGHLEIDTGKGDDHITMDHDLKSGRSLTLRSGGAVSVRQALTGSCPLVISSPGDISIMSPCICVSTDSISLDADATVFVSSDVATADGDINIIGGAGIIIDSGATVSAGGGDVILDGVASTSAGVSIVGATVVSITGAVDISGSGGVFGIEVNAAFLSAFVGRMDLQGISTLGSGIKLTAGSRITMGGGDLDIRAQGALLGFDMDGSFFQFTGGGLFSLFGSGSPLSPGTGYGARITLSDLSTDIYSLLFTSVVDSANAGASGRCIGLEISSTTIAANGVWAMSGSSVCDVADDNVGVLISSVNANFLLGSWTIFGDTTNTVFQKSTGIAFLTTSGSLPSLQLQGAASGLNPRHGLLLDGLTPTCNGNINLSGQFQAASGIGVSAVEIKDSSLIVNGDVDLAGVVSPSGSVDGSGVVFQRSTLSSGNGIDIIGSGFSGDASSVAGVRLAGASSLASFQSTTIDASVAAFQNDFGLSIEAGSSVSASDFSLIGTTGSQANRESHGVFLGGDLAAFGDSSVTGTAQATDDGFGLIMEGCTLTSTASNALFDFVGETSAFDGSSAAVLLSNFQFDGTDSPMEVLRIRGKPISSSTADCIRLEGINSFDGETRLQSDGSLFRSTRGNGIVITGTLNYSSMSDLALLGPTAVISTFAPEQCVGVRISGDIVSQNSIVISGLGPIGVLVDGMITSSSGSITVWGTEDPSSLGSGARHGVKTMAGSDIVANGSILIIATSSTNSAAVFSGALRSSTTVTLRGDGPFDVNVAALVVGGLIACSGFQMEGLGSSGIKTTADIIALTMVANGVGNSVAANSTSTGLTLSGSCNVVGSFTVTGAASPVDPTTRAFGILVDGSFELLPSSTPSNTASFSGSITNGLGAGIVWRTATVQANRPVSLFGTAVTSGSSAKGVLFQTGSSISTSGQLSVTGSAGSPTSATGLEMRGAFFSDIDVFVSGSLISPALGVAVRLTTGTRIEDTPTVTIIGDARDSTAGIGLQVESDINFLGVNAVHMQGDGGCEVGINDNPGMVLVGRVLVPSGALVMTATGCDNSDSGNHGIVIAAGSGLSANGTCSVSATGSSLAGANIGILFDSGTGPDSFIDCGTIQITASDANGQADGFNGISFLHPTAFTSGSRTDIATEGFFGLVIRADLSFNGPGEVDITSIALTGATVADSVNIFIDDMLLWGFSSGGDMVLGDSVKIISMASSFVMDSYMTFASLVFVGSTTDVWIAGASLDSCTFTASSVTVGGYLDAAAEFCSNVNLRGFMVTGESLTLRCGGTLTSNSDIDIQSDSIFMESGYFIEGAVNLSIRASDGITMNGHVGVTAPCLSFTCQTAGRAELTGSYTIQGPLFVFASTVDMDSANFSGSTIIMDAVSFEGDEPSFVVDAGAISISASGEFGSSPSFDTVSVNLDVQFFTGRITLLDFTLLALSTTQPSTGTLVFLNFSSFMPFGISSGCMTIDTLLMSDQSLLIIDLAQGGGPCATDLISTTNGVILNDVVTTNFNDIFDPIARGDEFVFIESPLTGGTFAGNTLTVGGFPASIVYGDTAEEARAVLGDGDVSLVINQLPVAVGDAYSTPLNQILAVDSPGVLLNDFDPDMTPLTAILLTAPSFGVLSIASDGSFTWDPQNIAGVATFTYEANDGLESSAPATVSLTSLAISPSPSASPAASQSSTPSLIMPSASPSTSRTPPVSQSSAPSQSAALFPSASTSTGTSVSPSPSQSQSRARLMSEGLVGPTTAPESPLPQLSPSSSASVEPSATSSPNSQFSDDDDDDNGNKGGVPPPGGTTTTVVEVDPDTGRTIVVEPVTGQPIATVDIDDPLEGTLVITVQPPGTFSDPDVVSRVLDIQFFVNGQEVTKFDDGIEICFAARDDDDACLGFFDDNGDWECEDFCLEVDDDNNSACGVTHHLTNFALLLDGNANSEDKCGSSEIDYVILYISAALAGCCCFIVVVSIVAIEIKIRHKKYIVSKELDTLARQTSNALHAHSTI